MIEEQVELDFILKAPVSVMRDLVDILNDNHLVEILTVTDGSQSRKMAGPVFLSVDTYTPPELKWEYHLWRKPTDPNLSAIDAGEKMVDWLDMQGQEGWALVSDRGEYVIMMRPARACKEVESVEEESRSRLECSCYSGPHGGYTCPRCQ